MMTIRSEPNSQTSLQVQSSIYLQNVHPGLAMFKHDLKTDKISFEDLQRLCDYNNESELITFLTDLGVHETYETREHHILDLYTQGQW